MNFSIATPGAEWALILFERLSISAMACVGVANIPWSAACSGYGPVQLG
ncbi:hypothetical protein [Streptomyces sp. NPDC057460]